MKPASYEERRDVAIVTTDPFCINRLRSLGAYEKVESEELKSS